MDVLTQYAWIAWLVLILVFAIIEVFTLEMTFLMLALGSVAGLLSGLTGIPWCVMMFNARQRMPTSLACCWVPRPATPPPKIVLIRNIAVSPSDRR